MTEQGRSEEPLASVEFEVLMEFQRQVKNRYDHSRILWFNAAACSLARQQNTSPNDIMKKALKDFEQFIAQVEKDIGPVPPGEDAQGRRDAPGGDDLDEFDQLLDDD
ncbi:MAG: hypothetical protein AMJ54_11145 [Deltaproteobacteria bacterium SG8_13]|nr:MAG: hypothetical protein AMJ54_11145 [Deltaproteobacteria bacterium SG8_13]